MDTRGELMELKNSRALITGGAGLVGSHIADLLVEEGAAEIVILDNFDRGRKQNLAWAIKNGPVTIVRGDIRDRDLLARTMQGIDVLFHQAAIRITQCAELPRLALEVLVDGTYNVMEAAVNANVKKVVAASSASVYGQAVDFPTREDHHPYANRTIYGAAKVFNEALLRSFNEMYGLDFIALRFFNIYGPRMDAFGVYTEVFIRWMERIEAGEPPIIFGDGTQSMDFIHVKDIARANILAAKSNASDDFINIASGEETSMKQLADTLLKVMRSDLQPEYGPVRKVNNVQRRLASTDKARELLGFETSISLEDGLAGMVDWWREEVARQKLIDQLALEERVRSAAKT
jgi:UDP-glucose 4-epimerase